MDSELKKPIEELDVVEGSNTIDVGLEGVTNKHKNFLCNRFREGKHTSRLS